MNNQVRDIDLLKTWCLSDSLNFTRYFFKSRFHRKFVVGRHHRMIADALNKVFSGETKKLIINIAPRYGKTEQAVKNFIANGLALNPKAKFIHLSYSDDLARDNSRGVQEIMRDPEFQRLFDAKPTSPNTKKWFTKQGGGLYAVSSAGQVTGFGAGLVDEVKNAESDKDLNEALDEFLPEIDGSTFGGAIIIDDPIKPDDALSALVRNKVNNKFDTTIRNRVNSRNTPIVIIMQRLHEQDLCGFLMTKEPGEWEVLSLPCIYNDESGEEKALWPFKQTIEELHDLRKKNPFVFDTQYMQNPKPLQGLMYESGFAEYAIRPATKRCVRKCYVDVADTGADYLCAIIYDETEIGNFIVDVLYTQRPVEYTQPKLANMLTKHGVAQCIIEANNGGRLFKNAVEKECRIIGNNKTKFTAFHQKDNKQQRIFQNSADVQNICFMPQGWNLLFPEFYQAITSYMKVGNNDHDDAPDALTGTVEKRKNAGTTDVAGLFGR